MMLPNLHPVKYQEKINKLFVVRVFPQWEPKKDRLSSESPSRLAFEKLVMTIKI